jgi:hypothetical protein
MLVPLWCSILWWTPHELCSRWLYSLLRSIFILFFRVVGSAGDTWGYICGTEGEGVVANLYQSVDATNVRKGVGVSAEDHAVDVLSLWTLPYTILLP